MATEYQPIVARIRAYIEIYQSVMGCGGAGKGMKFSLVIMTHIHTTYTVEAARQ